MIITILNKVFDFVSRNVIFEFSFFDLMVSLQSVFCVDRFRKFINHLIDLYEKPNNNYICTITALIGYDQLSSHAKYIGLSTNNIV